MIYKPKSPHKMKKFFAFALVASMMTLAACSGNKTEGTAVDSAAVVLDSAATVLDSATTVLDSAATMAPDTTKK